MTEIIIRFVCNDIYSDTIETYIHAFFPFCSVIASDAYLEHIIDISIYYTYTGDDNAGKLEFWIGNKQYASQAPLQHADSANLGVSRFTIALEVDSFTITSVGYNTPQRCDCDPTVSYTYFETTILSNSSKKEGYNGIK